MEFFASVFTVVTLVITIVKYVPKFAKNYLDELAHNDGVVGLPKITHRKLLSRSFPKNWHYSDIHNLKSPLIVSSLRAWRANADISPLSNLKRNVNQQLPWQNR